MTEIWNRKPGQGAVRSYQCLKSEPQIDLHLFISARPFCLVDRKWPSQPSVPPAFPQRPSSVPLDVLPINVRRSIRTFRIHVANVRDATLVLARPIPLTPTQLPTEGQGGLGGPSYGHPDGPKTSPTLIAWYCIRSATISELNMIEYNLYILDHEKWPLYPNDHYKRGHYIRSALYHILNNPLGKPCKHLTLPFCQQI